MRVHVHGVHAHTRSTPLCLQVTAPQELGAPAPSPCEKALRPQADAAAPAPTQDYKELVAGGAQAGCGMSTGPGVPGFQICPLKHGTLVLTSSHPDVQIKAIEAGLGRVWWGLAATTSAPSDPPLPLLLAPSVTELPGAPWSLTDQTRDLAQQGLCLTHVLQTEHLSGSGLGHCVSVCISV